MAGAGATRAIPIAPAVRSRHSARVSAFPKRRFHELDRPNPNPKSEGRNPKAPNSASPGAEPSDCWHRIETVGWPHATLSAFGFRVSFGFRHSGFGFHLLHVP